MTFEKLKMEENELMKNFANCTIKVANQIKLLGEVLLDERIVEKILICLLERFESKMSSL